MTQLDQALFWQLFQYADQIPAVGNLMALVTLWSSRIFALLYIGLIGRLFWQKSSKLVPALLAPLTAFLMTHGIRLIYARPRPFVALEMESLIDHAANGSFPSLHATSAFVIAATFWQVAPRWGWIAGILAALTGISRVMVGVHYPLDIVSGAVLGILISAWVFRWYRRNRKKSNNSKVVDYSNRSVV